MLQIKNTDSFFIYIFTFFVLDCFFKFELKNFILNEQKILEAQARNKILS